MMNSAFFAFERALAVGLARGQVLRCAGSTARAVDAEHPTRGPWRIEDAAGGAFEVDSPHTAARIWHWKLYAAVVGRD